MPAVLNHSTLKQRVYEALREMILSGELPYGAQIDEQAIARRLGVSRTPLREAIATLLKENLVEHRPWKGNVVRRPTASEVDGLYEVRKTLEALAARLAAARMTEDELAAIREALDAAGAALEAGDLPGYRRADQRFHEALALASGNRTLVGVLDQLRAQSRVVLTMIGRDPNVRDPAVAQRAARERPLIMAALERQDGEEAARLVEEHLERNRRRAVADLQRIEAVQDSIDSA